MTHAPELQAILDQVEEALTRWERERKLGEIAIIIGVNDLQVEERPTKKHRAVKRDLRGSSVVERVTPT